MARKKESALDLRYRLAPAFVIVLLGLLALVVYSNGVLQQQLAGCEALSDERLEALRACADDYEWLEAKFEHLKEGYFELYNKMYNQPIDITLFNLEYGVGEQQPAPQEEECSFMGTEEYYESGPGLIVGGRKFSQWESELILDIGLMMEDYGYSLCPVALDENIFHHKTDWYSCNSEIACESLRAKIHLEQEQPSERECVDWYNEFEILHSDMCDIKDCEEELGYPWVNIGYSESEYDACKVRTYCENRNPACNCYSDQPCAETKKEEECIENWTWGHPCLCFSDQPCAKERGG